MKVEHACGGDVQILEDFEGLFFFKCFEIGEKILNDDLPFSNPEGNNSKLFYLCKILRRIKLALLLN